MNSIRQGSVIDEHGCAVDPWWDYAERCRRRGEIAVVPLSRPVRERKDADMAEFGVIKSFQIDNSELDGLRPQECFVLGYELAHVDQLLKATSEIRQPVHADNRARIMSACEDAGRPYRLTWLQGDVSESWLLLEVERRDT